MSTSNDPQTESKELLRKVMRDESAPVQDRVDAAGYLLLIDRMPGILEIIFKFGELGLKEHFEAMPEQEQNEIRHMVDRFMRCNVLHIDQLTAWTPIKGHG